MSAPVHLHAHRPTCDAGPVAYAALDVERVTCVACLADA